MKKCSLLASKHIGTRKKCITTTLVWSVSFYTAVKYLSKNTLRDRFEAMEMWI